MREKFENRNLKGVINIACKYENGNTRIWSDSKASIVAHIVQIVNEYSDLGYILTLRQLHYQLVTRNWIINHDAAYKKLSSILDDCRYSGIIDWNAIEDRGRQPYIPYSADNLAVGLTDLSKQYRIDRQEGQTSYVELWTEKDALSGILRRSTEKYHIQLVVNKGYTSSSAIYNSYKRITDNILKGKKTIVLYFGDHDPSGLDMVRDIKERLLLFMGRGNTLIDSFEFRKAVNNWWKQTPYKANDIVAKGLFTTPQIKLINKNETAGQYEMMVGIMKMYLLTEGIFEVRPIGLTMEQITEYNLPRNPAKISDPRANEYIKQFGEVSWEVDALNPEILTSIVEENIEQLLDMELYYSSMKKEDIDLARLQKLIKTEQKIQRL